MSNGAKKKYRCPRVATPGTARPPTTIVETATSRPRSIEPASPMKIFAGVKLYGRNPAQMPAVTAAINGPILDPVMI